MWSKDQQWWHRHLPPTAAVLPGTFTVTHLQCHWGQRRAISACYSCTWSILGVSRQHCAYLTLPRPKACHICNVNAQLCAKALPGDAHMLISASTFGPAQVKCNTYKRLRWYQGLQLLILFFGGRCLAICAFSPFLVISQVKSVEHTRPVRVWLPSSPTRNTPLCWELYSIGTEDACLTPNCNHSTSSCGP